MISRRTTPVLIAILFLCGMFLLGQDTWAPSPDWVCQEEPASDVLAADPITGWMDRCENTSYVQGHWYRDYDVDSSVSLDLTGADMGEFCATGEVGQVLADGYPHWGAAMGFYLCQTSDDETPADEHFTISECPWEGSLGVLAGALGMRVTIDDEGSSVSSIRVVFQEAGRAKSTYVVSDLPGSPAAFDFRDASSPDGHEIDIDNLEAMVFEVVASASHDETFGFCVSGISFY